MSLNDKTVVVAGAGGGMGNAIVGALLEAGANVVGCDINVDSLSNYKGNRTFMDIEANLLDEQAVRTVFQKASDQFGVINGVVNAAGIAQRSTPIEDISLDHWHKIMDINMTMTFLMCREAAKYMKQEQAGSIVNIGSVSTTRPRPGLQSYVASKGAVESFSKALALELAPFKINVNVLHPGPCDTNMLGQFAQEGANVDEVKQTVFKDSVPLGELLTPEDIAKSVKFLLSGDASMITGSVLHVDGGRSV
ncbi:3-oxoacyl-[acyl-carrier protein] reductase [Oceanobacillus limi]|uniref:3-oxoacyl-[acyl-carrier protein] reductase n=1 Tax=Oceanobacillus limi TaxID=930131 RepID=A0A1I0ADE4_9BACI|nr:SDR family oxidoreductase [Oceanobacillus limi]SES91719.1 3-oxoacyl-[acyl-carrier protein] reductase [Oceanobacillus limi]